MKNSVLSEMEQWGTGYGVETVEDVIVEKFSELRRNVASQTTAELSNYIKKTLSGFDNGIEHYKVVLAWDEEELSRVEESRNNGEIDDVLYAELFERQKEDLKVNGAAMQAIWNRYMGNGRDKEDLEERGKNRNELAQYLENFSKYLRKEVKSSLQSQVEVGAISLKDGVSL